MFGEPLPLLCSPACCLSPRGYRLRVTIIGKRGRPLRTLRKRLFAVCESMKWTNVNGAIGKALALVGITKYGYGMVVVMMAPFWAFKTISVFQYHSRDTGSRDGHPTAHGRATAPRQIYTVALVWRRKSAQRHSGRRGASKGNFPPTSCLVPARGVSSRKRMGFNRFRRYFSPGSSELLVFVCAERVFFGGWNGILPLGIRTYILHPWTFVSTYGSTGQQCVKVSQAQTAVDEAGRCSRYAFFTYTSG